MSVTAPTAPSSTPASPGRGRHRIERSGGVRVTDLPGVRARMEHNAAVRPRNAFLRWLSSGVPAGRHTWQFLAGSGGRPRSAFAIILSL
ncbi:hypothetical protein [Geodermatophilus marinus]|uniref:hypothetical protein n=1 Tax=Geodermatophilus sp. LHW52908 TaxID=2303986 RepID=UPI000E3BDCA3|nr:hypothetical protein [Geodermatophilus sp. LHW52908]RFU22644.1 hypothetical protein D0Z06_05310 [Geodermatophilus sp. LHW52908]